jgi:hypothetical protein
MPSSEDHAPWDCSLALCEAAVSAVAHEPGRITQSTSGSQAGNALMTVYQTLHGKMTKQSNAEFERLGLGSPRHGGPLKDRDLSDRNIYQWIQTDLMPAIMKDIAAKGITDPLKIKEVVTAEIQQLFGVRTAAAIVGEMALGGRVYIPGVNAQGVPNSPFEKDMLLPGRAMGTGAMSELLRNDLPTILEAFNKQWTNLLETIGSPLMAPNGPVLNALSGLASALGGVGQFFVEHANVLRTLAIEMDLFGKAVWALTGPVRALIDIIDKGAGALRWLDKKGTGGILNKGMDWLDDWMKHYFDKPIPQKQSLLGSGFGGASIIPVSFNPGIQRQQVIQNQITLNIDGRTLAQSVIDNVQDLATHPAQQHPTPSQHGCHLTAVTPRHDDGRHERLSRRGKQGDKRTPRRDGARVRAPRTARPITTRDAGCLDRGRVAPRRSGVFAGMHGAHVATTRSSPPGHSPRARRAASRMQGGGCLAVEPAGAHAIVKRRILCPRPTARGRPANLDEQRRCLPLPS